MLGKIKIKTWLCGETIINIMKVYLLPLLLLLAEAERKTSIVVLNVEDMDPETARQLALNYTREMFAPLK